MRDGRGGLPRPRRPPSSPPPRHPPQGFYLKVGQFLANRPDFVALPVCRALARLFDRVPPAPPAVVVAAVEAAFGAQISALFDDFDAGAPLGAASVAQVHKAVTKAAPGRPRRAVAVKVQRAGALELMLEDLTNIRLAASFLQRTELNFDLVSAVGKRESGGVWGRPPTTRRRPPPTSPPADELAAQIRLEFDFVREAAVGDEIGALLDADPAVAGSITVPRSVPGLVSRTAFAMDLVLGEPLTALAERAASSRVPAPVAAAAARRLLDTLVEAYGSMLLGPGRVFQADPHPGNILVDATTARVGLLDFGQSKRLTVAQQGAFARLLLAMATAGDAPLSGVAAALTAEGRAEVVASLAALGVVTELTALGATCGRTEEALTVDTAFRMFDSRGRVQPFAPDSTLKMLSTKSFPPDLFFLLRTVQMLRGIATAAGCDDVSVAVRWKARARAAVARASGAGAVPPPPRARVWAGGPVPGGVAAADAAWAAVLAGRGAVPPADSAAASLWSAALVASFAGAAAATWAALAAAAPGVGPVAALTAGGGQTLARWAAAAGLQAAWPAVLLISRHPAAALAHGVAAAAALAAAALAAHRAAPAAALAMAPHGMGMVVGLAVNVRVLREARRRPGVVMARVVVVVPSLRRAPRRPVPAGRRARPPSSGRCLHRAAVR